MYSFYKLKSISFVRTRIDSCHSQRHYYFKYPHSLTFFIHEIFFQIKYTAAACVLLHNFTTFTLKVMEENLNKLQGHVKSFFATVLNNNAPQFADMKFEDLNKNIKYTCVTVSPITFLFNMKKYIRRLLLAKLKMYCEKILSMRCLLKENILTSINYVMK